MGKLVMRPPPMPTRLAVAVLPVFFFPSFLVLGGFLGASAGLPSRYLVLERAAPASAGLDALHARDRARHGRFLQSIPGVVDFPVAGSSNPFSFGLYFTRVKLGNPPKEFYVQIDTGSDILWVSCNACDGCPTSSGLNIELEFFNPDASSTASLVSCADQRCSYAYQMSGTTCMSTLTHSNLCPYSFQYGDGSGTSGYYVSDTMHFETIFANEQLLNSSATVVFGCSNSQSGDLTKPDRAVDGIFGFGQHELSVISQLSSLGVAPKVFSHCLRGSDNGGGILVLGEIVEPGMVYTPLVGSQPHYNLNLQSIAVNGQKLPINPSVFATSNNQGTIVDSGTTLAYLAEQAYDPFINAITASTSPMVQSTVIKGNQCFVTPSSIDEVFPSVTLTFGGNAEMVLRPQDYLLQQGSVGSSIIWCIGWQKSQGQGVTILGDLVLKDKIFVYDLAGQRLGWANYDCSVSVNVSTHTGKNDVFNAGQLSVSGLSHTTTSSGMATLGILSALLYIFIFPIKLL